MATKKPHVCEPETLLEHYPDGGAAELDVPYEVLFCAGCGLKTVAPLSASRAEQLGIRIGRIVADTLTNTSRSDQQ